MAAAQDPSKVEIPIFPMKLDEATVQRLFEHAKIPLILHAAEFFSFFPGFESAIINFFFKSNAIRLTYDYCISEQCNSQK